MVVLIQPRLSACLSRLSRAPLAWGVHDCLTDLADWAIDLTGQDPAAPWRGRYADEAGAAAILQSYGGLIGLLDYGLVRTGWSRVGSPVSGCLGAVPLPTRDGRQLVGAIRTGGRWAARGTRGRLLVRGDASAMWTHPALAGEGVTEA